MKPAASIMSGSLARARGSGDVDRCGAGGHHRNRAESEDVGDRDGGRRLVVGERIAGRLRVVTPSGQLLPTPMLTLDVPSVRHRSGGLRGFAFDPAGQLFGNVGSPPNVAASNDRTPRAQGVDPTELQQRHGGIWRFQGDRPNQDQIRDGYRYASGLRHVLSLAWHPVSQAFFVVQMGRDQLDTVAPHYYTAHDNAEQPAEEMHLLRDQVELGWPTTYWDPLRRQRMLAPEFGGDGRLTAEPGRFPDPLDEAGSGARVERVVAEVLPA